MVNLKISKEVTENMLYRFCRIVAVALTLLLVLASGVSAAERSALFKDWSPYAIMRDENSLYIRWKTAEPSQDTLTLFEDGATRELGIFSEEAPLKFHSVLLEDLLPGAALRYRIQGTKNAGMKGRLRVPRQGIESTFLVMSDTQALPILGTLNMELSKQKMLIEAMARDTLPVDFLVHTGDLVESGAIPEYNDFFQMISPLTGKMPLFAIKGNHDDQTDVFIDAFSFLLMGKLYGTDWHHFSTKNALFVFLNLNFNSVQQVSQTVKWLDAVLKAFKDRKWKFVFTHQPIYSSVERDSNTPFSKLFEPLFMKYGVDVVFSGHHHAYQRILRNGIVYVVSGGGGGRGYSELMNPRVEGTANTAERTIHYLRGQIKGDKFVFEAKRVGIENKVEHVDRSEGEMDRFELSKP